MPKKRKQRNDDGDGKEEDDRKPSPILSARLKRKQQKDDDDDENDRKPSQIPSSNGTASSNVPPARLIRKERKDEDGDDKEEEDDDRKPSPIPSDAIAIAPTARFVRRPLLPPPSIDSILEDYYQYESKLFEEETTTNNTNENGSGNESSRCKGRRGIYLNHGSFGDPYSTTLKLKHYITTTLCYEQPMVYHRELLPKLVQRSKQAVYDYLKLPNTTVSGEGDNGNNDNKSNNKDFEFNFTSVTNGLFSVLNAIQLDDGNDDEEEEQKVDSRRCREKSIIITTDTLYHSIVDTMKYLNVKYPSLRWIQVKTDDIAHQDDIYKSFETTIYNALSFGDGSSSNNGKQVIKLVIVDHISSKPSIVFPIERICQLCRELKLPILVDGAHVPGIIPRDKLFVATASNDGDNNSSSTASTKSKKTKKKPAREKSGTKELSPLLLMGGATFYTMTFHKWCNVPRGNNSGGLYVNLKDIRDFGYDKFIDISKLVVHPANGGKWQELEKKEASDDDADSEDWNGYDDDSFEDSEVEQEDTLIPTKKKIKVDDIDLYLNHALTSSSTTAFKPSIFTDQLTQGIYDESTREYENIILLPYCFKLTQHYETEFQNHIKTLRYASLKMLQEKWNLPLKEQKVFYEEGEEREELPAMLWYGDMDDDSDHNSGFFHLPMLSIPLPTDRLVKAAQFHPPPTTHDFDPRIFNADMYRVPIDEKLKGLKNNLGSTLWNEYSIEVPIFVFQPQCCLGVRISFNRHVQLSDIEYLGDAVLDIMERGINIHIDYKVHNGLNPLWVKMKDRKPCNEKVDLGYSFYCSYCIAEVKARKQGMRTKEARDRLESKKERWTRFACTCCNKHVCERHWEGHK